MPPRPTENFLIQGELAFYVNAQKLPVFDLHDVNVGGIYVIGVFYNYNLFLS